MNFKIYFMKSSIFLLLLLPVIYISCEDKDTTLNLPKCIDTILESYQPACQDSTTVDEYLFQQQLVYLFDNRNCCCDFSSYVLSTSCDSLGFIGGIAGFTHINGEDFSNAVFQRTVWP